jgi:hypothetical protein
MAEERAPPTIGDVIVTKDDTIGYWVRLWNGSYWSGMRLCFFKFNAIRLAKRMRSSEVINGNEPRVWP